MLFRSDLCRLLTAMGAEIEGIGTSELTIHGAKRLHGATYRVMPDRIEAGSYACAAAITGGDVLLEGARASLLQEALHTLKSSGIEVEETATGIRVARNGGGLNESFTVRKISYGEGVERVFPIHSPNIDSIKVVRRGKVRRAKLYYLRDRRGKSARIAERQD